MNNLTGMLKISSSGWGFLLFALATIFSTGSYSQERESDNQKTLNVAIPIATSGFDPAKTSDLYSYLIIENIFDSLLTVDYLARPFKLVPNTAASLPVVTNEGKTYTIKVKPGIYFSDDPAFKGNKRELVAADYVYSFKRFLDETINSPSKFLVDGKFVGAKQLIKESNGEPLNYDTQFKGVRALDKYTLQINLIETDYDFANTLADAVFGAVAREVIEANSKDTMSHPIGTGPYLLADWTPGSKIILEANPNFRTKVFDFAPDPSNPFSVEAARVMNGKTLPQIQRININIIEEEQPTWLAFLQTRLDMVTLPNAAVKETLVIDANDQSNVSLAAKYKEQGISLQRFKDITIRTAHFNMEDPVVGGYEPQKIALRRAIAMAFPLSEYIARFRRGQAVPLTYIIPDGAHGHNPNINSSVKYDPAKANALLDAAGYNIGADGYRTQPDGAALTIEMGTTPSATSRQQDEFWQKTFDSLKIKLIFKTAKWSELLKEARDGGLQMWGSGYSAGIIGRNYLQRMYGPNKDSSNIANFDLPAYNKLYEASLKLPSGEERQALYDKMNQLIVTYQPHIYADVVINSYLSHSNVLGYSYHPLITSWRYLDLKE